MIWLGNKGIDITDREAVLTFVGQLETGVVQKGGELNMPRVWPW